MEFISTLEAFISNSTLDVTSNLLLISGSPYENVLTFVFAENSTLEADSSRARIKVMQVPLLLKMGNLMSKFSLFAI